MKHTNTSWNASAEFGLMDTFLSLPYSKRWMFAQAAKQWWKFVDWVESVGRSLDPREIHVNERLLEIPFVLQRLPKTGRILDVGCTSSAMSLQLACLGYQVTGVDVREYPFRHPNLCFLRQDITQVPLDNEAYDCAILISTVEHMGLGAYGDAQRISDREFLQTITRFVKPGGVIYLTMPFGRTFEGAWFRVYDSKRLAQLVANYQIVESKFFRRLSLLEWRECREEDLAQVASERLPVNGVALLMLRK
jgi:SAM-dependent methyltransferase